MLRELLASLADNTLEQKLKRLLNPEMLLIDEIGFDRLEQHDARNANLFHKVIDGRYGQGSTIITTNLLCGAPHKMFYVKLIFMRSCNCVFHHLGFV